MNAREALAEAERRLGRAGIDSPRVDAELLLAHVLGTTRSGVYANLDRAVDGSLEALLSRRGRLWAWTTQDFPPPSPPYSGPTGEDFVPFGVGYVELPGEVKVETRLTEADPEVLVHGMEMELAIVPFRIDDEGNEVVTFAFRPVA